MSVSWQELKDGDIVEWEYILDRGIEADGVHNVDCKIKMSFCGIVASSRLTGLWITKTSRKSELIVNEYSDEHFRRNFYDAMQSRVNFRIKVKQYMRFDIIERASK